MGMKTHGRLRAHFFPQNEGKKQFLILAESISKNNFQKTMLLQEREWYILFFGLLSLKFEQAKE